MTTKKTERITFYDEKERRWIEETIELKENTMETSQVSDKNDDKSEHRMVY
jgi:hypothetical protein